MQQIEIERKYVLAPGRGDAVLDDGLAIGLTEPYGWGDRESFGLVADYVDTLELALIRSDHTLRRRVGGGDEGWHLKGPKREESRVEVHLPLTAGRSAALVPWQLRAQVADVVGLDALVPVARLVTERTEHQILRIADGAVVALMADDRVQATPVNGPTSTWREVEVELVDGTVADLDAIESHLRDAGLLRHDGGPKLARALGLAEADRDDPAVAAGTADEPTTVGAVVVRHLRRQVGAIQGLEGKTRSDVPDAVHKSRVATRRLRSTLRSFRRFLDRSVTDPIALEVRWLGERLGAPRDAEVLRDRLTADLAALEPEQAAGDVRERLPDALDRAHAEAHADLVRALDSDRTKNLMEALAALLIRPPLRAARAQRRAAPALAQVSQQVTGRVAAAHARAASEQDPDHRLELLHEVRKKAKAARYAHEAFGHLGDDRASALAERWEEVTESLGELQDATVAIDRLQELAAEAAVAGQPTAPYELLVARQQERATLAHQHAEQALARASKR